MKLAFVFRTSPHGNAIAREGLDALLAASAFCDEEEIGVFFIGDGIFNLIPHQNPETLLQKDFIASWKLLDLYEIQQRFLCADGKAFDLWRQNQSQISVRVLTPPAFFNQLNQAEKILTF